MKYIFKYYDLKAIAITKIMKISADEFKPDLSKID
jgi:hypothetical protein